MISRPDHSLLISLLILGGLPCYTARLQLLAYHLLRFLGSNTFCFDQPLLFVYISLRILGSLLLYTERQQSLAYLLLFLVGGLLFYTARPRSLAYHSLHF